MICEYFQVCHFNETTSHCLKKSSKDLKWNWYLQFFTFLFKINGWWSFHDDFIHIYLFFPSSWSHYFGIAVIHKIDRVILNFLEGSSIIEIWIWWIDSHPVLSMTRIMKVVFNDAWIRWNMNEKKILSACQRSFTINVTVTITMSSEIVLVNWNMNSYPNPYQQLLSVIYRIESVPRRTVLIDRFQIIDRMILVGPEKKRSYTSRCFVFNQKLSTD